MKKKLLRGILFLLTVSLMIGILPISSIAADNELVLTKVGHKSTDSVSITNPSTRSVTLTVPYQYTGNTVDLSKDLIVEKASSIGTVITDYYSGSTATIGSSAIIMTVTYYKGTDTTTKYTAAYSISVIRAAQKNPTFTGTIIKSATGVMPNSAVKDISFSSGDFTKLYTANDGGAITKISMTGNTLISGSLKIVSGEKFTNYTSGNMIDISDIGSLVFDATSGGSVSYIVNAYAGAVKVSGDVLLNITVNDITVPTINSGSSISKSANIGASVTFTMSDFSSLCNLNNGVLDRVEITPTKTDFGEWYNGASALSGTAAFTSSTIGNLKFTGRAAGSAAFTWKISNEAGFSAPGSGSITVKSISVPTITASVSKSVELGSTVSFTLNDFSGCYNLNDGTMTNIVVKPANNTYGTWYKGSTAFTGATSFDANNISTLKFKGTLVGQADFSWTVSNEKGASASGSGNVKIASTTSTTTYTTAQNTAKTFTAADFNAACKSATGTNLSYIYFPTTSASYGALYYDYSSSANPGSAVTANSAYNYNSAPNISKVTFVPTLNYSGTLTISYIGVNTNNESFTGNIKITVGSTSDIAYSSAQNTPKTFSASDFNTACTSATGFGLSSASFSPPAASLGTLYYNYTSASNPGTAVTTSTVFYNNSAPYLSSVTFVPASNFTGTVTIPYTGVNTNNISYTGSIKISVGSSGDVTYLTAQNTPKTFSASDFNTVCTSVTGYGLSYTYFTPPSATSGTLYFNYVSVSNPGTTVTTSTVFYNNNAPYLSSVTFVPASNFTGTITIPYTGVNINNTSYTGYVKISVGGSGAVSYSTGKNTAKTFAASDFNTACTSMTGYGLTYVNFTLPSSSNGKLYYNYSSSSKPGTATSSSTKYYYNSTPSLSSVTFVPASNYTGTVTISYTGVNTDGATYSGSVVIKVTGPAADNLYTTTVNKAVGLAAADLNTICYNTTGAALNYVFFTLPTATLGKLYYNDTSSTNNGTAVSTGTAYYIDASPYLRNVTFVPAANYTGSVAVSYTGYDKNGTSYTGKIVIQVNKQTGSNRFTDVGLSYAWAAEAIDFLYDAGIVKGTGSNTYTPSANITRGDFILMLYNALHFSGSKSSNFPDVPKGSYYYDAIAIAKSLGIAQGYNNKFNPTAALTRQDAMLLIYKALLLTGESLPAGTSSDISKFTDKGTISSYALTAVETLVKAGLITGDNSKINPEGTLSRAEMAVVLYRVKITY